MSVEQLHRPVFALPCPCLRQARCSIYAARPNACRRYKCRQLRDVEAGAETIDQALDRVMHAKRLVSDVHSLMPAGMTLSQARAFCFGTPGADAPVPDPARAMRLKLAVAALGLYLDRYFKHDREGRLLSLEDVLDANASKDVP